MAFDHAELGRLAPRLLRFPPFDALACLGQDQAHWLPEGDPKLALPAATARRRAHQKAAGRDSSKPRGDLRFIARPSAITMLWAVCGRIWQSDRWVCDPQPARRLRVVAVHARTRPPPPQQKKKKKPFPGIAESVCQSLRLGHWPTWRSTRRRSARRRGRSRHPGCAFAQRHETTRTMPTYIYRLYLIERCWSRLRMARHRHPFTTKPYVLCRGIAIASTLVLG